MQNQSEKNKEVTDRLLEKSKALREKSKTTESQFNELKAKVDEFIHPKDQEKAAK